jgi:ATP-dependent RNA helicase DDX49/DBP8
MSFNNLRLSPWVLKLCQKIKYNKPTEIQSLAIPSIAAGKSVIINSETGSGKTATFSLPTLDKISKDPYSIYAIVIAPSLELALQIHQQL